MTTQEMLKMRMDGATFDEIADAADVSRQVVQYRLKQYSNEITKCVRGSRFCVKDIKFKAIREHFMKNEQETAVSFAMKVYGYAGSSAAVMRNFLKGKSESYFTIAQIKRMCEVVGKPFEQVFEEVQ